MLMSSNQLQTQDSSLQILKASLYLQFLLLGKRKHFYRKYVSIKIHFYVYDGVLHAHYKAFEFFLQRIGHVSTCFVVY